MAKPKKQAPKAPTAGVMPVWIATLASNPKRKVRVIAGSWYAARSLAMAALGCEPGQLEVREDGDAKEEKSP